jgi:hypothetical protein
VGGVSIRPEQIPAELRTAGARALARALDALVEVQGVVRDVRNLNGAWEALDVDYWPEGVPGHPVTTETLEAEMQAHTAATDLMGLHQLHSVVAFISQIADELHLEEPDDPGHVARRKGWIAEAEQVLANLRSEVSPTHEPPAPGDVDEARTGMMESSIAGHGRAVRTMRLAIVDEHGAERITADAESGSPTLSVDGRRLVSESAPKATPTADAAGRHKGGRRGG